MRRRPGPPGAIAPARLSLTRKPRLGAVGCGPKRCNHVASICRYVAAPQPTIPGSGGGMRVNEKECR